MPMCGFCANYTETEVLCEACVEIRQTEQFVATQAEQLDKPDRPLIVESAEPTARENPAHPMRRKQRSNRWQWVVIVVCFTILVVRLYFSSTIDFVPLDDETRARELAITSLSECLSVFRQIGQILERGNKPGESLRCDASGTPNIVTQTGREIKISHPHPDFYGYVEIFVTSNNPEPTLVE